MEKKVILNGYVFIYRPNHPRARNEKASGRIGWLAEHILIAEQNIGRPLREKEVVHHLDFDRANNRPDNLLVLENSQHTRLHNFLRNQEKGVIRNTVHCKTCKKRLNSRQKDFCSTKCSSTGRFKVPHPSKKELFKLVWEKPCSQLAKDFGVSDVAIAKWCKKYEIEKPPRGYWAKQRAKQTSPCVPTG